MGWGEAVRLGRGRGAGAGQGGWDDGKMPVLRASGHFVSVPLPEVV